jgi:ADP-ribose pyrophosphatase
MEKPHWRVRSSTYLVDSEHLRIRSDEIELPNGTVIPNYYIRESSGFTVVFALTPAREVVLVRQYRYGLDDVILEFPAGTIDAGEDPLACAQRELTEETGYVASRWELLATVPAEPVRSNSLMHAYLAFDAIPSGVQHLDITEAIEPLTVPLDDILGMLRSGVFRSVAGVAVAYAALDRLGDRCL